MFVIDLEFSSISHAHIIHTHTHTHTRIHRYFTSDEAVQKISTSSDPVQQCLRAAQQNSGEEVVTILEAGLEQAPSSEVSVQANRLFGLSSPLHAYMDRP